ncbi:MAG: L-seryl-tRNA(Sec) selenium transferase [Syntrophales bacterium]|jgi:L-seryl-tRNA(Ser) seleniumtransferase|nr:L-seryl-tRNA(Sec) selenium transferase [Syntrophales bacterium]MDY0043320.1 L-seryl-tRNA(Sec) selenium transferase [Syntrophales bacterium]
MNIDAKEALRRLPKMDDVIKLLEATELSGAVSRDILVKACRSAVDRMRMEIINSTGGEFPEPTVRKAAELAKTNLQHLTTRSLRKVVNATGIILHTNLGRAPLCKEALEEIICVSEGYSNLEFDLETGRRGFRYTHVRDILCALSGAEDALVVNNNAAAVLIVLNTLAEKKEAIVSRGELIEIGGEFRIPEIMKKSGSILVEVGTTNRTHVSDYVNAVNENTGIILKVHTSNFRTIGFTEEVDASILVDLGTRRGIPVMTDLGSGCFIDLQKFGLSYEPTVQEVVVSGVDVVTFSGDKLLGGPQAGIILGRRAAIEKIKGNPLNRALRIDKLTLAALEATLRQYLKNDMAAVRIRILKSLTAPVEEIQKRAKLLLARLEQISSDQFSFVLKKGISFAGGGALPLQEFPTAVIAVRAGHLTGSRLEKRLRSLPIPIVTRIYEEEVLIDLRTVDDEEIHIIEEGFRLLSRESEARQSSVLHKA